MNSEKFWIRKIIAGAFLLGLVSQVSGQNSVVKVEPNLSELPANFLKFYLTFPEEMERGTAFDHLALFEISEKGDVVKKVADPFREVELWDESGLRLTLWLHPGRQKPGVNLNVELGPILEKGKRYRLEISRAWPMVTGENLPKATRFEFVAGEPKTAQLDPARWEIDVTKEKTIFQAEWLDPISLRKRILVELPNGKRVKPTIFETKEPGEYEIRSLKNKPFAAGDYRLVFDPKLEDLAGNSIARPFNLDLKKMPDFEERTEETSIRFRVE